MRGEGEGNDFEDEGAVVASVLKVVVNTSYYLESVSIKTTYCTLSKKYLEKFPILLERELIQPTYIINLEFFPSTFSK